MIGGGSEVRLTSSLRLLVIVGVLSALFSTESASKTSSTSTAAYLLVETKSDFGRLISGELDEEIIRFDLLFCCLESDLWDCKVFHLLCILLLLILDLLDDIVKCNEKK